MAWPIMVSLSNNKTRTKKKKQNRKSKEEHNFRVTQTNISANKTQIKYIISYCEYSIFTAANINE